MSDLQSLVLFLIEEDHLDPQSVEYRSYPEGPRALVMRFVYGRLRFQILHQSLPAVQHSFAPDGGTHAPYDAQLVQPVPQGLQLPFAAREPEDVLRGFVIVLRESQKVLVRLHIEKGPRHRLVHAHEEDAQTASAGARRTGDDIVVAFRQHFFVKPHELPVWFPKGVAQLLLHDLSQTAAVLLMHAAFHLFQSLLKVDVDRDLQFRSVALAFFAVFISQQFFDLHRRAPSALKTCRMDDARYMACDSTLSCHLRLSALHHPMRSLPPVAGRWFLQ